MDPTSDIDDAGVHPVIRPSSTTVSSWPAADTIGAAAARQSFVEASSKPLTVTLSQRTWKGLALGAPFADRGRSQPTDPAPMG